MWFAAELSSRVTRSGLTPYAGRERELDVLMHCVGRAVAGEGQFVTIAGDAGVGKSRLLYEMRRRVRGEAVFVEGRCQSYGKEVSYLPFVDSLLRGLQLRSAANPEGQPYLG